MKWKRQSYMVINKVPSKLKAKVASFLSSIDKHMVFLKDFGYNLQDIKIATEYAVDYVIEVIYRNEKLNRIMVIHYEPIDIDENTVDLLTLHFYNDKFMLDKNKLEFDKYLKKYIPEVDLQSLNYPNKNNRPTFEENIDISVSGYSYYLKESANDILIGMEWEDGLTFDWSSAEDVLYKAQKRIIYGKKPDEKDDNRKE